MNNKHQENGALRGPLIFTLPTFSFGVILSLDWLDGTGPGSCFRQNARSELSGNSAENGEGFRGRGVERKAGSWKKLVHSQHCRRLAAMESKGKLMTHDLLRCLHSSFIWATRRVLMMIYHWRIAALLITFVIGVTNPANATPTTFNIEGNVSEFSIEGLPDYGLSVGDRFSGTLTYQLTGEPDGSYYMSRDMSDGMSYISGFLILEIEVEGKTFSNGFVSSLRIIDDPSGDSFGIRNAGNDGAWSP